MSILPIRLSKYCITTMELQPNIKQNRFKKKLLFINKLKQDLKDKKIGEDEWKNSEKKIQKLTDSQILELEKKLKEKEKEIMTV